MKNNANYNFNQIDNFCTEKNYTLIELGGCTIGRSFITLEHNEKDLTVSFVLTGYNSVDGNIYTCVYSDAKEERKIAVNTIAEIKALVDNGYTIYVGNENYFVIKDKIGQYLIKCAANGHLIGLHSNSNKLNGESFYYIN